MRESAGDERAKHDRFAWPVPDEQALEVTCARIARHLARSATKIIGFLPATNMSGEGGRGGGPGLAPLLVSLAGVLARFVDQDIAIIDHWRNWRRGGGGGGGAQAAAPPARLREVRPRVVEVTPLPSDDAEAAAVALQNTLRAIRNEFGAALVDLGGYAGPGTAPSTLVACDGVVLVVRLRRARIAAVDALAVHVPSVKRLGAILIGSAS
jgi:hypothetical protein